MRELSIKLKALKYQLQEILNTPGRYYDPAKILYLFHNFSNYQSKLKRLYPTLFDDSPSIEIPIPSQTTDFEGRGYITREKLELLLQAVKSTRMLLEEGGNTNNPIEKLSKDLTFIIEEAGSGLSISGPILEEYRKVIKSLEDFLTEDLSSYVVNENYSDDNGSWGDGNLFRIKSKSLQVYIQKYISTADGEEKAQGASDIVAITTSIKTNLRRMFSGTSPQHEKEVQREIEKILNVLQLDLKKEQDQIPVSVSGRIPDFTVQDLSLALEAKICNSSKRIQDVVEEINSDITTYKSRYNNIIFVVYDTGGFINDMPKFIGDFEKNKGVQVIIVKH